MRFRLRIIGWILLIAAGSAAAKEPKLTFQKAHPRAVRRAIAAGREYGKIVKQQCGFQLILIETEHFLIWTDWPAREHRRLAKLCERMYRSLARQFHLKPDQNIWVGKCPVFLFRETTRYNRFAKIMHHYEPKKAAGYCHQRSDGRVHLVVARRPRQTRLSFAEVICHEGTHAFLHRLWIPRPLIGWINEGLAEATSAELVRGSKKRARALKASLQWARKGRALEPLLKHYKTSSPPGRFYPIAQTLVEYLIQQDRKAFRKLVFYLKHGVEAETALKKAYHFDYQELTRRWRNWVIRTAAQGNRKRRR